MVTEKHKLKIDWTIPKEYSSEAKLCDTCNTNIEFWENKLPLIRNLVVKAVGFDLIVYPPWLICESCQIKFKIAKDQTELDFELAQIIYNSIVVPLAKIELGIDMEYEFYYEVSTS